MKIPISTIELVLLEELLLAALKAATNYGFLTNHGNCKYSEQDY